MSKISVINATYESGYKLRIEFSDNTFKTVDFEPFLTQKPHEVFDFYRKPINFKKFKIKNGYLVWGKNWDLVFPVAQLHQGFIELNGVPAEK